MYKSEKIIEVLILPAFPGRKTRLLAPHFRTLLMLRRDQRSVKCLFVCGPVTIWI